MVEPKDQSEPQLKARRKTNNMTPLSRNLAKETTEIDLKANGARPEVAEL